MRWVFDVLVLVLIMPCQEGCATMPRSKDRSRVKGIRRHHSIPKVSGNAKVDCVVWKGVHAGIAGSALDQRHKPIRRPKGRVNNPPYGIRSRILVFRVRLWNQVDGHRGLRHGIDKNIHK